MQISAGKCPDGRPLAPEHIHRGARDGLDIVRSEAEQAALGLPRAVRTTIRVSAEEVFQTEMMWGGGVAYHADKADRDLVWRGANLQRFSQLDHGKHLGRARVAHLQFSSGKLTSSCDLNRMPPFTACCCKVVITWRSDHHPSQANRV